MQTTSAAAAMAPNKAEAAQQVESRFWTTRNYILAALGGALGVTAITIALSIVLRPGHITFTVVHSSSTVISSGINGTDDTTKYLNLTITAANESQRRAAVRYKNVFVDLKNSSTANGRDTIPAQLLDPKPDDTDNYQRMPPSSSSVVTIRASVLLVGSQDFAGDRASSGGFTVVVTAQVKFRVWKIPTRQYDIKVSCPGVLFPEQQAGPMPSPKLAAVNCTG